MHASEPVKFNYRYLVALSAKTGGRVLDYGCGGGEAVALGLERGLDIWGTDTYEGYYAGFSSRPDAKERVRPIIDGRADFPDQHFAVLFSNQVLEHVTDPEAVIADMHRLLRPGGVLIAAFPVTATWYEGHTGVYFVHWFDPGSRWRRRYFELCHRLGLGLYRGNLATAEWTAMCEKTLDQACYYYPRRRMVAAFENAFQASVEDIAADYMRTRIAWLRELPAVANPLLRLVYHVRAGEIYQVRKPT
jgi:SAM-dependent methyltransferase